MIVFHINIIDLMKTTKYIIVVSILFLFSTTTLFAAPKVVAHRGYWNTDGSAQNSLTALIRSADIEAFGSEFDVVLTADNKLVVTHGPVYQGVNIEQTKLRTLRSLRLSNGERIPTLDVYFKLTKKGQTTMRLIVEMKPLASQEREEEAVNQLVRLLKKHHMTHQCDFISFSLNMCKILQKTLPESKVFYLSGKLNPQEIKSIGLAGLDYHISVFRKHPEWVQQSHDLGLEVNVWTVNSEEDMQFCIDLGVDYITTDYPERLQRLISSQSAH